VRKTDYRDLIAAALRLLDTLQRLLEALRRFYDDWPFW
jgi:hypothetical protein